MRKLYILAGLVFSLTWTPSAFAQYELPYSPGNYTYTAIQGSMAMENLRLSAMLSSAGRSGGQRRRTVVPTTFRPVAGALLPAKLAAQTAKSPSERREAEQFFMRLLDVYKSSARQRGLPANEVSRAVSFMIISTYEVYNDNRRLSEPQREALRAQMRAFLGQSEDFQRLSARDKQEMFESCIIAGMFLGSAYEGAQQKGDREALAKLREAARQQLEESLEMPIGRISFTESGIVTR